jgi:hypothetical protein
LAAEALRARKRKRHATPLTSHTLAGELGLEAGELARALAGEAVSVAAAKRLATWASAGDLKSANVTTVTFSQKHHEFTSVRQ